MVEPLLCCQVTGGQFFCTSKGTYGTRTDFEQQLLLPVADPSSDHVRLALYDVNKAKAASTRNFFARYLGKFINSLSSDGSKVANPETTLREGAIPEEGPGGIYEELGELQPGVQNMLQHCSTAARHFFFLPDTFNFYTIYAILRDFYAILHDFYTILRIFCNFYAIFCQTQIFCCQTPKTILHPW